MSFNSIWLYKYLFGWVGGIQLAHCSRYLIRFGLLGICIPLDVFFYTEFSAALSPGAMKLQEKFRMNSFGSRLSLPLAQCTVCQMRGFPFCYVLGNNCQNMSIHEEFLFCQFFGFKNAYESLEGSKDPLI